MSDTKLVLRKCWLKGQLNLMEFTSERERVFHITTSLKSRNGIKSV